MRPTITRGAIGYLRNPSVNPRAPNVRGPATRGTPPTIRGDPNDRGGARRGAPARGAARPTLAPSRLWPPGEAANDGAAIQMSAASRAGVARMVVRLITAPRVRRGRGTWDYSPESQVRCYESRDTETVLG